MFLHNGTTWKSLLLAHCNWGKSPFFFSLPKPNLDRDENIGLNCNFGLWNWVFLRRWYCVFAYSNLANTSDWTRHFSLRIACCSCVIRTLEEITHVFCYPFLFYGIWAKPYLKNTVHHKNSFTIMNLFLSFFSATCRKVGFSFPLLSKSIF